MENAKKRRQGIDWHAITFWSCLGIAIVYIGYAQIAKSSRKDGRILTIFSEEGREEIRKYYRNTHPAFASKMGW